MVLPGYPPEDLLLRASFVEENLAAWREVAGSARGVTVVAGFVDRDGKGRVYNAAGVAADGRVLGVYRKMHLPNYGVFDEMRYFRRGTEPGIFPVGDARVGITICEDIWVRRGPVAREAKEGADLILNISASPYHAGKWEERRDLVAAHARRTGLPVAYCNLVGGQDELVFDGGSMVVAPRGEVIARAAMFSEELLLCEIGGSSEGGPVAPIPPIEEEIFRALVLGTRDYVEKNRFPGAIIGLSGGIDSSLVAAVAAEALGPSRVLGVTLSSPFTSRESVEDAHALASNLGIRCLDLSIGDAFAAFGRTLAGPFAGRAADTTEENLQARIRGTILMALSNKFGEIVLTTGNKSEMSVGYATLYGDMAGGFARHQGRLQDDGVPRVAPVQREPRAGRDPGPGADQASLGGASARPEGLRLPSRVRSPRSDPEDVRGGGQERPGDGGGGVPGRCRAAGRDAGGPERVQASPGPTRRQDHPPRPGEGPPDADHEPVERIGMDSSRTGTLP